MKKLQNIQALRGVAVLSVLLFHLVIIEKKYGGGGDLLPDWLRFGMFGVDLFFVISGFVMVTVTRGKFGQTKSALLFLYHRVSRIYPLYWVYTTLALLVFLVQPSWVNNSQGNQVDIAASYLLLPTGLLPLVQVGWTLIHEMYFYLVFFIILAFVPEKFLAWALLLWAAGIGISGFPMSSPLTKVVFNPLTFEFIAGCLLAVHYHESPPLKVGGKTLAAAAVLGLVSAAFGFVRYNQSTGLMPVNLAETLLYGIPAVVIVFCITHAERNGVLLPGFLVQLGNVSYSVYLSHLFTANVVGKVWGLFATDSLLDNAIAITIAFALALAVGFLSYRALELPLLKLTRKIA
jgi:exopolysaccharide production protein ExoZ